MAPNRSRRELSPGADRKIATGLIYFKSVPDPRPEHGDFTGVPAPEGDTNGIKTLE